MSPFLILCSLSPHTIITNLCIFLPLSYSFLLVAGWWMSYSYRCFLLPRENKKFHTHFQECHIFMTLSNICHPELNSAPHLDGAFKTRKTGTVPGKLWQIESLVMTKMCKGDHGVCTHQFKEERWIFVTCAGYCHLLRPGPASVAQSAWLIELVQKWLEPIKPNWRLLQRSYFSIFNFITHSLNPC
jgi:hypothetical protein